MKSSSSNRNNKLGIKTKAVHEQKLKIIVKIFWAVCAYLTFLAIAILISPRGYFLPKKAPPVQYIPPPMEKAVQGHENYPKLWGYYLNSTIRNQDIGILSNYDALTLAESVDSNSPRNAEEIKNINPSLINLVYITSSEARCGVGGRSDFANLVDANDWWLYDYEGNKVTQWPGSCSINQTYYLADCDPYNHDSYYGDEDCAFEALANYIVNQHVEKYSAIWDGVFYDVFVDNQRWYSQCRKDPDRDGEPNLDYDGQIQDLANDGNPENDCPFENASAYEGSYFDDLWSQGMTALVNYTLSSDLAPALPIVGNGLNRNTLSQLNGRYDENFSQNSSHNISKLCSTQHYVLNTEKNPPLSIINGMPRRASDLYYTNKQDPYPNNDTFENPQDYQNLRWTMGVTLLTDAYFSFDFGSQDHGETLWYDEYNIKPDGEIAALTTVLTQDIDKTQQNIPVESTQNFTESGLVLINGEQIYYDSKTNTSFHAIDQSGGNVGRGYPHNDFKYDLRAPHSQGATVIQYDADYRGYLGQNQNDAYDLNEPDTTLNYLIEGPNHNNWYCWAEDNDINSRIYRRDFEHGTVVVNPTDNPVTLTVCTTPGCSAGNDNYLELSDGTYRLINGLQDSIHNNGDYLTDGYQLTIESQDSYILIKTPEEDTLDLTLTGDSQVPQGGILNTDILVVNNTPYPQTFDIWFDLTKEENKQDPVPPLNNIILGPGSSYEQNLQLDVPQDIQKDTYTLTAYVGPDYANRETYDDFDDHIFEVTGRFNPRAQRLDQFNIAGSTAKLWLEAEDGALTLPMVTASDPQASNNLYILVTDGTQNYGPGQAIFTFNITKSDNYVVWGRAMTPDGNADSFRVQMDTEPEDEWHVFQGLIDLYTDTWGWDQISYKGTGTIRDPEFDPKIFNLTQGTHTLTIKNREDGTKLDKLLITNDLDYVPSGIGG